jgi:transcriptional regulator with XRE-family HTH domain
MPPRTPDDESYGAYLRRSRLDRGLTQKQLAEMVGVDFTYVSKVENGRLPAPSEATITQLAKALKADPDAHLAQAKKVPLDVRSRYASYPVEATRLLRALHERKLPASVYAELRQTVEKANRASAGAVSKRAADRSALRRATEDR